MLSLLYVTPLTIATRQLKGEGLVLSHVLRVCPIMAEKAWRQVTLSSQEGGTRGKLSSLSPSYLVWNPSLRNSAALIQWTFLLQLRLPGSTPIGIPRGVSMVILNPITLTMKIDSHNPSSVNLTSKLIRPSEHSIPCLKVLFSPPFVPSLKVP